LVETKPGGIRGPARIENEFVQRHAGVLRKLERGAIGEGDVDRAVGAGLMSSQEVFVQTAAATG
jgi:hypothetical protein